jgi:hypothetical protein
VHASRLLLLTAIAVFWLMSVTAPCFPGCNVVAECALLLYSRFHELRVLYGPRQ